MQLLDIISTARSREAEMVHFCDLMSCENSKVVLKLDNFSKVIIAEFRQSE